jgi:hypothetical protein
MRKMEEEKKVEEAREHYERNKKGVEKVMKKLMDANDLKGKKIIEDDKKTKEVRIRTEGFFSRTRTSCACLHSLR